ncbi:MAG: nucleoside deaminase [Persephonella sp.]|nr:MAG: nucleoside deaminase [Persephonella sp.]
MLIRDDIFFLRRAYEEALKAYYIDEVPVGAVIVKDKKIIGTGFNQRVLKSSAICHAEIVAIEDACKNINNWRLDDAIIYTTLEPCLMCLGAVMQARIRKVVFGAFDLKGGAFSKCSYNLQKFPFNVEFEFIFIPECSQIIKDFFKGKREKKEKIY